MISALLNLLFCAGIAWACLCRLNLIKPHYPLRVILRYAILMTVALTYGVAPLLFKEWPSAVGTTFSGGVFVSMVLSLRHWGGVFGHFQPRTRKEDRHGF